MERQSSVRVRSYENYLRQEAILHQRHVSVQRCRSETRKQEIITLPNIEKEKEHTWFIIYFSNVHDNNCTFIYGLQKCFFGMNEDSERPEESNSSCLIFRE